MYNVDIIIEKIDMDCFEIHKEDVNHLSVVVSKNNLNKISNQLRECDVELHFNYGIEIICDVII